jgi:hypothetical protein
MLSVEPIRWSMQRAIEPGHAGGYGRERVDPRGAHHADGRSGAVLLVVGVQDEEDVERPLEPGVGLVPGLGHLKEHREKVARVGEIVVGVDVGQPEAVTVRKSRKGRHLGDKTHSRDVPLVLVVYVGRLGVEGGERTHRRQQHTHRVGVVPEAVHEVLDVLVDVGVVRDLIDPLVVLVFGRQVTVDQEVRHLQISGLLAQLLDWNAPVLQDALLPIYVGDGAPATRRVRIARIVGHKAEVVLVDLDSPEIHRTYRAIFYLHVIVSPRAIVPDSKAISASGSRGATVLHALRLSGQPVPLSLRALIIYAHIIYMLVMYLRHA